jgi:hypothetical protein
MIRCLAGLTCIVCCAAACAQVPEGIAHCREVIRSLQLPEGAFRMSAQGDEVRIVPYFANAACNALLAANQLDAEPDDLQRVRKWIDWYAGHVRADGTILDHLGKVDRYEASPKRDSIDTYAPSYLIILQRYTHSRPEERASLLPQARLALAAIERSIDPTDGLAWASVPHKVKYPMDNLEVCIGLQWGFKFFEAAGAADDAAKAGRLLDRCRAGVATFWLADKGYFAWAKSTRMHVSFEKGYPDGVVNLFAAGCIDPPSAKLWENLRKTFADNPRLSPDMWLTAARRVGAKKETEQYRQAVTEAACADDLTLERAARLLVALISEEPVKIAIDRPE